MEHLINFNRVNMAFDWAVAPGLLQCSKYGFFVAAEMLGEVCQRACMSGIAPTQPRGSVPLPDDAAELARQRGTCGDLRRPSAQFLQV
jgi:hypothetical protein